ncbi:MAG: 3-methyl-2-oxobutanoate dehydrogenase subunit VorB [Clostridia bacterium]|nr:3-methyl-2-oxobutanoate dehydrogenase subunit VorB [Clostridia bacterium]
MGEKVLMKGNDVIAEASIRAGCKCYFGYPITPQTEISHYLAEALPKIGGVFLQAESEIAAINMVYGASSAGIRAMTSSSSPGISLKQEGISYIAGAEIPAVVVNVVRCGPGLGGILPGQCDYFQATKGGGHGDYHNIVLAPNSVQELYELTVRCFNLADKYRMCAMLMADGSLGQMMEAVEFREIEDIEAIDKPWATNGMGTRGHSNYISSVNVNPDELEKLNQRLQAKYREVTKNEIMYEEVNCDNADIMVVSYGTTSRIIKNVIKDARKMGINVGLFRPISLWPFPYDELGKHASHVKAFLSVELSAGQMIDDVRLSVNGKKNCYFYGRTGGNIPSQKEILDEIVKILEKEDR